MTNSPPYPFLTTPVGSLQIPFLEQIEGIIRNNSYILKDKPQLLKLSLVIPTYNERDNVIPLVENLSQLLDQKIPDQYELIIVDDDSPDRTWELASKLTPDYPQLRVMRRQGEKGLASAVVRGWQGSRGEILGVIDGDLQHPPEILYNLLETIEKGADLALASRHVEGGGVSEWSLLRRFSLPRRPNSWFNSTARGGRSRLRSHERLLYGPPSSDRWFDSQSHRLQNFTRSHRQRPHRNYRRSGLCLPRAARGGK